MLVLVYIPIIQLTTRIYQTKKNKFFCPILRGFVNNYCISKGLTCHYLSELLNSIIYGQTQAIVVFQRGT